MWSLSPHDLLALICPAQAPSDPTLASPEEADAACLFKGQTQNWHRTVTLPTFYWSRQVKDPSLSQGSEG